MPPLVLLVLPCIALLATALLLLSLLLLLLLLLKIAVEEGSTLDVLKAATGVLDGRVKGKLFDFSPFILSLATVGDADFLIFSLLNMMMMMMMMMIASSSKLYSSSGFNRRRQVDFNSWR
jgi:hypothetical protein